MTAPQKLYHQYLYIRNLAYLYAIRLFSYLQVGKRRIKTELL